MKIEYMMAYLRIVEDSFNPSLELFIPEEGLTYTFEKDKPRKLEEAEGVWVPLCDYGLDGWELYHIIPKNLYLVGMFKRVENDPIPIQSMTLSECISAPVITTIECTKNPNVSFIEFEFMTVNKPKPNIQKTIEQSPVEVDTTEFMHIIANRELESIIVNTNPPFCETCGSSIKRRWFRPTGKCIHPSCPNYWNKK